MEGLGLAQAYEVMCDKGRVDLEKELVFDQKKKKELVRAVWRVRVSEEYIS